MELLMILSLWLVSVTLGLAIEGITYWRGKAALSKAAYKDFSDQISHVE